VQLDLLWTGVIAARRYGLHKLRERPHERALCPICVDPGRFLRMRSGAHSAVLARGLNEDSQIVVWRGVRRRSWRRHRKLICFQAGTGGRPLAGVSRRGLRFIAFLAIGDRLCGRRRRVCCCWADTVAH